MPHLCEFLGCRRRVALVDLFSWQERGRLTVSRLHGHTNLHAERNPYSGWSPDARGL